MKKKRWCKEHFGDLTIKHCDISNTDVSIMGIKHDITWWDIYIYLIEAHNIVRNKVVGAPLLSLLQIIAIDFMGDLSN